MRLRVVLLFFGLLFLSDPAIGQKGNEIIKVEEFDRAEILKYHEIIIRATDIRDRLIEMAARRYKVNLKESNYDVVAGQFKPKLEDVDDKKK